MSDRLKDLELELRDIVLTLKDVSGTQWYDLGLQLELPPSTLDTIAAHHNVDDHKRMMLRKWLQGDPEASWEKLAAALTLTGHETTASVIRRRFSLVITSKEAEGSAEEGRIRRCRCSSIIKLPPNNNYYNYLTACLVIYYN